MSYQILIPDNIAKAKFGLARVHALCGNTSRAAELALSAQEQFVRMDMEYEVTEVDALLRQIGNKAGRETINGQAADLSAF